MRRIRLACGRYSTVSNADYPALRRYRWFLTAGCYAARWAPRERGQPRRLIYMHQAITGRHNADHRDGNGLHNMRRNLRPASPTGQHRNARRKSTSRSPCKGASFHRHSRRWCAQIMVDGTRIWLGLFDTAAEAGRAYDKAARRYFGRFACVNWPKRGERRAI